jgi:GT2 family glycosyltransferase/glycosyltransferase involved in cell wall biosynthesis
MNEQQESGQRRIAFVSERMLRGFGVDLVIDEVATELVNRGRDVTVYASVVDDTRQRNYRLDRIPTRASGVPPRYQAAARHWAKYIDAHDHDVVFVESFPFFSLIPHLRTPSVAVDHGVSSSEGMRLRQRATFKYIEWTQQNRYFPAAAAIITISEYIRSLLPGRLQQRTQVVYNGGDHYPMASMVDRQAIRARLGISDDRVMALYVGRLNPEGQPYKGAADLMRMAARWREELSNITVVMAGLGEPADAARIRQAGAVPLLDVPEEDMGALYAAADIYLSASRWEGFNLPLVEAARQGVPSVCLNIGPHPEVVHDKETGILVRDIASLAEAARLLANDAPRRRAMGESAREWLKTFTWSRAADGYERIAAQTSRTRSSLVAQAALGSGAAGEANRPARQPEPTQAISPSNAEGPEVTGIVLNYGASLEILRRCIDSVASQTIPLHILLVDNDSPKNQDALDRIKEEFPAVELLRLSRNWGFAGGMNRGIAAAKTEYVLLLNNDVTLAPNAAEEMRKAMVGSEDVVGIAPKILLENPLGFIDAIGNLVDGIGQAYNMGIGQLDIGQYDRVEPTFGACFAATLIRRDAFRPGLVGPLDERYFMYYEDVDWCFRAGVLGYKFITCPTAVVNHMHSMSTRELDYGYKYRLIMRNFVLTLVKDFQGRRAHKLAIRRCLGLTRNVLRGPHRQASLMALKDIGISYPGYLRQRREVQGRRKVDDQTLFNFSHGEQSFFDPVNYAPLRRLETLHAMYNRMFLLHGEERYLRVAQTASVLMSSRVRFDRDFVQAKLGPLVAGEPPCVQAFVQSIEF